MSQQFANDGRNTLPPIVFEDENENLQAVTGETLINSAKGVIDFVNALIVGDRESQMQVVKELGLNVR